MNIDIFVISSLFRNGVYEPSRAETLEDIRNELRCLSAQFEAIFQVCYLLPKNSATVD